VQTLLEASKALESGEFSFMKDAAVYDKEFLLKGAKAKGPEVLTYITKTVEILGAIETKVRARNAHAEHLHPGAEVYWH